MNRIAARCAAILVATASAWGQTQITWTNHVDPLNGASDHAADMVLTPNSSVIVVGRSELAPGSDTYRMIVSSWSTDGTHQWSTSWQNPGELYGVGTAVAVAADGSIYVAGLTEQAAAPSTGVVVRFDAAGNFLAAAVVPFLTQGFAIAIDVSGDVLVAGPTRDHTPQLSGVARLTASLNPVWQNSAPPLGTGGSWGHGLAIGTAGEVYVSSRTEPHLQCFDASGAYSWTHTFGGGVATGVCAHPAGGAVVAGGIWDPGETTAFVARVTASGVESWRSSLEPFPDYASSVQFLCVDPSGRIAVAGMTAVPGATSTSGIMAGALDADGNQVWEALFQGGVGLDIPGALSVAENGDVFIAGRTGYASFQDNDTDLVAWCLGSNGQTRFAEIYAPPQVPKPVPGKFIAGCAALPGGGFVIAGEENTYWTGGGLDLLVMRVDAAIHSECFGFGFGAGCPCANTGALGHGCANSVNPDGALLAGTGFASVFNDSLQLSGSGMPDASALYFQGTTQSALPFGDGKRCAGGTVVRLGIQVNASGASQYPGAGDPPVSVQGAVMLPGTRVYQTWYRNSAAFCTAATFNLSNAVVVDWIP